jgi:hypothetical protein
MPVAVSLQPVRHSLCASNIYECHIGYEDKHTDARTYIHTYIHTYIQRCI